MPPLGTLAIVLHSHIPYVLAHGQWPHGTDWLTEVAAESYIPLLDALHDLATNDVPARLAVGLTPILCEQLADDGFKDEFTDWLEQNLGAAAADARRFRADGNDALLALAQRWRAWFRHTLDRWTNAYGRDLVGAFRAHQDAGRIEIITSAATHGYLPLLLTDRAVAAQVRAGAASYERHFARKPRGFWLPECAYRPRYAWQAPLDPFQTTEPVVRRGIDEFLSEAGIGYTFVDGHLLRGDGTQGVYAERFGALRALWHQFTMETITPPVGVPPYRPCFVQEGGEAQTPVAVFGRDARSSHAVWAADGGYPGDEWYLEFHKQAETSRLRYWRVSFPKDDLAAKQPYDPHRAYERTLEHARHFVDEVKAVLREQRNAGNERPIVTALYDTELFGHWWHEGALWLKEALRLAAADPEITLATPGDYLDTLPPNTPRSVVRLPEGSWGEGGFHGVWLHAGTEWMWERIYAAEREMATLVDTLADSEAAARALRQAARELLLLEASDWPFVTSTGGAPDYAAARVKAHALHFDQLALLARAAGAGETIDPAPWRMLAEVEQRDNPFPDIDPAWWR